MALLSSFAEMGLKLRLDMPEQVMDVATVFFRNSTPPGEAQVSPIMFLDSPSHLTSIYPSVGIFLLPFFFSQGNHEKLGRAKREEFEDPPRQDESQPEGD